MFLIYILKEIFLIIIDQNAKNIFFTFICNFRQLKITIIIKKIVYKKNYN